MKRITKYLKTIIKRTDALSVTAFAAFILFSLTLYCAITPIEGEQELYKDIIRFHVLANSDSDEDQALKLKVRDTVTEYTTEILKNCGSIAEAKGIIVNNRQEILRLADECINESGYSYSVSLTEGFEEYPKRIYGKYTFPRGTYYSVRLNIGSGKGKNWWCVLFPPLCRSGATVELYEDTNELKEIGFTDGEIEIISEEKSTKTEIRLFFLDLIYNLK